MVLQYAPSFTVESKKIVTQITMVGLSLLQIFDSSPRFDHFQYTQLFL